MLIHSLLGILFILRVDILAKRNCTVNRVTKGDQVNLTCSCSNPTWHGPPNETLYAVDFEVVNELQGKVLVHKTMGSFNLILSHFSGDSQGKYLCQSVDCVRCHFLKLNNEARPTILSRASESTTKKFDRQNGGFEPITISTDTITNTARNAERKSTELTIANAKTTDQVEQIKNEPQSEFAIYIGCLAAACTLIVFLIVVFISRKYCFKGEPFGLSTGNRSGSSLKRSFARVVCSSTHQDENEESGDVDLQTQNTVTNELYITIEKPPNIRMGETYVMVKDNVSSGRYSDQHKMESNLEQDRPELVYTEVSFDPVPEGHAFLIHGKDDEVPYADIDLSIKAEPLQDSDEDE